ncbi:MarR family transcriptional regulator [Micromonospora sp. DR5-3]|uniref:MarR family winged helix-turn-helix transcriptional regulator n=1 Tax=unclassified Micromonospora TaxID=2617518 RepID=UPI0011D7A894|nr:MULTISPECIES: MarR family transcriptional regulator [unclassified Micromonospora]MCW3815161.1 MarR family transcriptional regulator [Micromonospora sp. DR5-3]TYC19587.1 MarR family transcriptional regulator [Micromonospora sp. MP36]
MSKSDLAYRVAREIRLLQQSFDAFDEAAAARIGVNRTDLRALDVVLGAGPVTAGELAAELRLSPAATTTVIDRLERAGLVARTRDADNRRRVLVEATESARAAERTIYRPVGEAGLRALARYDSGQLETILDFLSTARIVQQEHAERVARETSR